MFQADASITRKGAVGPSSRIGRTGFARPPTRWVVEAERGSPQDYACGGSDLCKSELSNGEMRRGDGVARKHSSGM